MKKNHYKKIDDFRGLVNKRAENTAAFERMQYMRKKFRLKKLP